jgi:hypothetical protein
MLWRDHMPTRLDRGSAEKPQMLRCERLKSNLYTTLVLALRDMRDARGRDSTTGVGEGTPHGLVSAWP